MGTHPSTQGRACLYTLVPWAAGEHVPPLQALCWEQWDSQPHGQLSVPQHQER